MNISKPMTNSSGGYLKTNPKFNCLSHESPKLFFWLVKLNIAFFFKDKSMFSKKTIFCILGAR